MNKKLSKYRLGVIHGRFQILHNDHMKYLLASKDLCEHLIVGITNPDPSLTRESKENPHRDKSYANPLTYYERYIMIRETILEEGLKLSEFSLVPFPINYPQLLHYYVPMDAVFFLTIYDQWGRKKKKILEKLGLKVHVLWEVPIEQKGLSSSDIRQDIINKVLWKEAVPSTVARFVEEWNLSNRLKNLRK